MLVESNDRRQKGEIFTHHPCRHVRLSEDDARGRKNGRQCPAKPHRAIVHGDRRVKRREVRRRGTGVRGDSRVCGGLLCLQASAVRR